MSVLGTILSLTLPTAAAPDAETLRAAWEASDLAAWVVRPAFSDREWAQLAGSETVRRRERLDGPDRVVGAVWSSASRDALWLAIQDEAHWDVLDDYVDEDLSGSTFADRFLYQRIGLPWPLADRQWVIRVQSNRSLLTATAGRVWERTWVLSNRRGATAEDPRAVWVPENEGGWVLCDAAGGNLLVYHVRAGIGGAVPDEAATQWALMTVAGMIGEIDARAREEVRSHYTVGHAPIERPDGSTIPWFVARAP